MTPAITFFKAFCHGCMTSNNVHMVLFEKFMKLLAGHVGQSINEWLSIIEASYVVFRLPPYFENFGKRVIKTPKIYFTDTGLCDTCLALNGSSRPRLIY
jgi:hypothetical protein